MILDFNSFINEQFTFDEYKNSSHHYDLKIGDYVKFDLSRNPCSPEYKGEKPKMTWYMETSYCGWQGHDQADKLANKIGKIVCIKIGSGAIPSMDQIGVQFFEQIGDTKYYDCDGRGRRGYCRYVSGKWLTKIDINNMDDKTKKLISEHELDAMLKRSEREKEDPFGEEMYID